MLSSSIARSRATRSRRQYCGRRKIAVAVLYFVSLCRPTSTFSITVMSLNRRMFWKVRAMPMRLTCSMVLPAVSMPSSMIMPRVG